MPRANWGISARDVDDFDRDSQYTPYDGPIPVNGIYRWQIKKIQHIAATGSKLPQLRIGLELIPRDKSEKRYKGYFLMAFLPVSNKTAFRYVPFLDAIGVSGRDFETRTVMDQEGNITKIGGWRNSGSETIRAEIKDGQDGDGNPRKEIGWMGEDADPAPESDDEDDYDEEYDDDEDSGDDDWE